MEIIKIKDDVDISILQKLGFTYDIDKIVGGNLWEYHDKHSGDMIIINTLVMEVHPYISSTSSSVTRVLFDMFQTGICEKVVRK